MHLHKPVLADKYLDSLRTRSRRPEPLVEMSFNDQEEILVFKDMSMLTEDHTPWPDYREFVKLVKDRGDILHVKSACRIRKRSHRWAAAVIITYFISAGADFEESLNSQDPETSGILGASVYWDPATCRPSVIFVYDDGASSVTTVKAGTVLAHHDISPGEAIEVPWLPPKAVVKFEARRQEILTHITNPKGPMSR